MYGHTDDHDEQCSGQPLVSTETIAKVEQEMLEDRRVTVRELCKQILQPAQCGRRVMTPVGNWFNYFQLYIL